MRAAHDMCPLCQASGAWRAAPCDTQGDSRDGVEGQVCGVERAAAQVAGGTCWGRTMVKVVPASVRGSSQMRPSWFSTMDLTMDRPSPVPAKSCRLFEAR